MSGLNFKEINRLATAAQWMDQALAGMTGESSRQEERLQSLGDAARHIHAAGGGV